MKACCKLGTELGGYRVLHETDNFFVMPTLGQMGIEGYLLILSKDHKIGVGDIPESQHKELEDVLNTTRGILESTYKTSTFVFEHGPRVCNVRGGGCLDHAHLHVVPGVDIMEDLAVDMMHRLGSFGQFYRVDRVEGFQRMGDIYNGQQSSYLFVNSPNNIRLVAEVNYEIPSQYLRQMIAQQINNKRWDWKSHPDLQTIKKTIDRLGPKF